MRMIAILASALLLLGCGENHDGDTEPSTSEAETHMLDSQQKALKAAKDTARALEEAAAEEAAKIRQAAGT